MRALIDTGASCTCIDPHVLKALSLTPTGVIPVHTPSTGSTPHLASQYDIDLVLLNPRLNLTIGAIPVTEANLRVQGIDALIGRDVLANCLLVYDGQSGIFNLAF